MLQRGLTEVLGGLLLAIAAAGMAGCGAMGARVGPPADGAAAAGPDPALLSRYEAAVASLAGGDEAAAREEFLALAWSNPDYAGPALNLALLESRAGREAESLAYLAQAARVCSRCGAVYSELGIIRRRQGRFDDAEQAYRRALQLEPGYVQAAYNLAVLYDLYVQRPDLALPLYEQYVAAAPGTEAAAEVEKWVADLRRRTRAPEAAAKAEGES